jgi:hypothetical protein
LRQARDAGRLLPSHRRRPLDLPSLAPRALNFSFFSPPFLRRWIRSRGISGSAFAVPAAFARPPLASRLARSLG